MDASSGKHHAGPVAILTAPDFAPSEGSPLGNCPFGLCSIGLCSIADTIFYIGDEDLSTAFRNNAHLMPAVPAKPSDQKVISEVPVATLQVCE